MPQESNAQYDCNCIKETVIKSLLSHTFWEKFYGIPIERDVTTVYNGIIDGIITFVEQKSYDLALRRSKQEIVAENVKRRIRDEITRIVSESYELPPRSLSLFIGHALEEKVNALCEVFVTPYHHTVTLYPSHECCVCLETLSNVNRIYLFPCGHDICKKCCQENFFTHGRSRCPICNQNVDIENLRQTLFSPSAPPYWMP